MLRRLIPVLLLFFLLPSFVFAQEEILEGRVVEVIESKEENGQFSQKLEVLVTKGTLKDKRVYAFIDANNLNLGLRVWVGI